MSSDTKDQISVENCDFTLHGDGGLTLHFPPGKWQSKSTVEGVIKALSEFETTVKKLTLPPKLVGSYFVFQHPIFEGKIRSENR